MRAWIAFAMGLSFVSCKKASDDDKAKEPVSTADQDALWALAPSGTELGVVFSSRAVGLLDGARARLRKNLDALPELASVKEQLDGMLTEELGTTDLTLELRGMTPTKPFAMFSVTGGRVMILPVVDRDKFVAYFKGTKGADADTFADRTCKMVHGVYACAKPASLLDGLGKNGMPDRVKLVGGRGDIEVAASFPATPPISFAMVAQLDKGAATLRIAVKGVAGMMPMKLATGVKPRVDANHTVGFGVMDLSSIIDTTPPVPVAPGVTADQVAHTITGPLTLSTEAGVNAFDIRVPLSDPAPMQKVIDACPTIPPLQALGATVQDGTCHVAVPQMMIELDAWTEGKELRIGTKKPVGSPATVPLSAIGRELAGTAWPLVVYGRGTMFATPKVPDVPTGQLPDMATAMLRTFSLLDELGIAMRMDGDTVRGIIAVRTVWANPDDVIEKLQAIDPKEIMTGAALAKAKAIADGAKGSPFAADLAAGWNGLMAPTAAIGMMAATAIPAFMQYMKKSKVSEASLHLNRLAKFLKAEYAATSKLPIGKAPLTPAQGCCGQPHNKCSDPAAWAKDPIWSQLEFSVDEPGLYQYDYESTDGKSFVAHARGDLDCDGTPSIYTLKGSPTGDMLSVTIEPPPRGAY